MLRQKGSSVILGVLLMLILSGSVGYQEWSNGYGYPDQVWASEGFTNEEAIDLAPEPLDPDEADMFPIGTVVVFLIVVIVLVPIGGLFIYFWKKR